MNPIPSLMTLFLLGHILGDFYFQTDKMAENKNKYKGATKHVFFHGFVYFVCMGAVLLAGVEFSKDLLRVLVLSGVLHLAIDFLKRFSKFRRTFSLDQLAHIVSLVVLWCIWGEYLTIRDWVHFELPYLQNSAALVSLGLLTILKPIGILVAKGDIWDFSQNKTPPNDSQQNAGRMIGYLERIIIFFLILNAQYGAIAFVMAAKSVARFPEISNGGEGRSQAEYYLIGTLISVTSVFIVTLLLGLGRSPV